MECRHQIAGLKSTPCEMPTPHCAHKARPLRTACNEMTGRSCHDETTDTDDKATPQHGTTFNNDNMAARRSQLRMLCDVPAARRTTS